MSELKRIRLKNPREVSEYLERPTRQDAAPTMLNAYIYWCLDRQLSESDVDIDPVFADDLLEGYAHNLAEAMSNEFAYFDLNNTDSERYGDDGQDKLYGRKRDKDNVYLQAALFIRNTDRSQFAFSYYENSAYRAIYVKNLKNNTTFAFKDVIDWSMFYVMKEEMKRIRKAESDSNLEEKLKAFTGQ